MKRRTELAGAKTLPFSLRPRRSAYYDVSEVMKEKGSDIPQEEIAFFEKLDMMYRTICGILYNFVPLSGHPGGSLSSGRIVEGLLYNMMDYDFSKPDIFENDMIAYAAGHKAMGLYAMWALRNELIRQSDPKLLAEEKRQLRLEDLLGFRRNPTQETPLFNQFHAKALDGHPSCVVPFVKTATGPSGIGVPAALGLAMGAMDMYPDNPPMMNIIEGEGGMTPGRVHEALPAGATAQLYNVVLHVDWNQSTIDSDRCTAEGDKPGDYVQWDPRELLYLHDWNVIYCPEGHNFSQIFTAQKLAYSLDSKQPTAIVYRTVKGWSYGITGKASHGAGHKFCSDEYYKFVSEFENMFNVQIPRFTGEKNNVTIEKNFWDSLLMIRKVIEQHPEISKKASEKLTAAKERLEKRNPKARKDAPVIETLYTNAISSENVPDELKLKPGTAATLRGQVMTVINYLNKKTGGAFIGSAADLFGSTSLSAINKDFPQGFYNAVTNPGSRLIPVGGICEDAMGCFMSGLSSYRNHIGVTASYSAFITAMEHTAARTHSIGQQNQWEITGQPFRTWIILNGHAGPKTGEDGPTHADPQPLQLFCEGFPKGKMITLTPWDACEIWHLMVEGLKKQPAVLSPFVTRPEDIIVDRAKLRLPDASAAIKGVYAMRKADMSAKEYHGTLVLQGNGVATIFVSEVLEKLDAKGINMNVYYVASTELFGLLPDDEQEKIFPEKLRMHAFGMSDFTLPTMYKWVRSEEGVRRTLYPFRKGHYLGSGSGAKVLEEAGIHADGQVSAVLDYAKMIEKRHKENKL